MASVCVITAIYGNYDSCCKRFENQTIPTDFICFTDNASIKNEYGWIIDTTPYHFVNKSPMDNTCYVNSLCNNSHTFNICKYYKTAFQNIPRLQHYKAILWIDGSVEIINNKLSEYIVENIDEHKLIAFDLHIRKGSLYAETQESLFDKYLSTSFFNQNQPSQDVIKQYNDYMKLNFNESIFRSVYGGKNYGVWLTCFVVFHNHNKQITRLLDKWYHEILTHTTQDQISFPFVCQVCCVFPHTLSSDTCPQESTMFYKKYDHDHATNSNCKFETN